MKELYSPAVISGLLKKYELAPLKKLGQNFLKDGHIVEKIAQAAVEEGGAVLEVGPGLGVLTSALAERAAQVAAIELDGGMVRVLGETLAEYGNVRVLHQDILKTDLAAVGREIFGGKPFCVVGNLPYYITSKCLLHVMESGAPVERFTAMVQKEVADRLAAREGEKEYGALSASLAYYGRTEKLFGVSRGCFLPEPDVDSAVIQLRPQICFPVERAAYARVVRGLFSMRRKTVLNNMKSALGLRGEQAQAALAAAGISPAARAETLSPEDFARLAGSLG